MAVITHSRIRAFESCPMLAKYTYEDCIKPKLRKAQPLERGTWFHKLLEEYYAGRSWQAAHDELVADYDQLFDEEKEALGDLPGEMNALMKAYIWHYGEHQDWNVLETEGMLECPLPDGLGTYRMKYDLLIEDERGLWLVDHKTHLTMPDTTYRLLDKPSTLYVWCARQNGIPVNGFIWNYIVPKAPTVPKLVDKGTRLSKVKITTDFPTVLRAIREYGLDPEPYKPWLRELKAQRWQGPDAVQTSQFFRRDILQKDEDADERMLKSVLRTVRRMNEYVYDDETERTIGRGCSWCSYRDLCTTELVAGPDSAQARNIRRQRFQEVDPFAYYGEQK